MIEGKLVFMSNPITTLEQLDRLERVGGDLQIRNMPLSSLHGLEHLREVGGGISVYSMPDIRDPRARACGATGVPYSGSGSRATERGRTRVAGA